MDTHTTTEKRESAVLRAEERVLAEEKKTLSLLKREAWLFGGIAAILLIVLTGAGIYLAASARTVSIDDAQILAPEADIAAVSGGVLKALYVKEGDIVGPDTVVARVGDELLKTQDEAEIISVPASVGQSFAPGQTVVTVIDPADLRVVGTLQENKGLADIAVGDRATFTVDAFGGAQYDGVVDEVSPTSHASDVVFSISDQRQEQSFDVKVRFDVAAHPELKNGMSAKITVYKQ